MKKIIYILSTLLLLSSCKSIEKMVESGQYDKALRYGVDKLRGKENKKTKYVKALEKAYLKLNNQDLNEIRHLELSGKRNRYDRIVDIYDKMEKRQNYVMPLLPLISEDGYLAEVKIIDYTQLIYESSKTASETHYSNAIKHLELARRHNDKLEARRAYDLFEDAQFYFNDYKDSYELKNEAYELGQSRILVEQYTKGSNIAFEHTLDIISEINVSRLNSKWEKFYINDNGNTTYNYIATMEVTEIIPGIERERINTFTETKRIIDGQIPIKDRSGKVITDTLGNILYTDRLIDVSATISEIQREKIAQMNGRLVIIDALNNMHVNTVPINVTHEFNDYACTFQGDERALSEPTHKRIKVNVLQFPSDYEITTTMAYAYKTAAEDGLDRHYFKN
ncbi:MAG: hypothetical protein P1U56_13435 [Saprospiraceae bacterium]|nr:hypothetical protein [Saprospiraceae bacterium]